MTGPLAAGDNHDGGPPGGKPGPDLGLTAPGYWFR
jgi:hypothetical protein